MFCIQAKEAWDAVESFRTNDLATFAETIKNVAPMIDGPKSLSNRVLALETQMLNGTSMTLSNKGVRIYYMFALGIFTVYLNNVI